VLVPTRDSAAVAEAVVSVLTDRDIGQRLGDSGRAAVYPTYSSRRLIGDVEQLYLRLAKQKRLVAA
jgi:glycosyltransferase involved in cell wall biosynthesis